MNNTYVIITEQRTKLNLNTCGRFITNHQLERLNQVPSSASTYLTCHINRDGQNKRRRGKRVTCNDKREYGGLEARRHEVSPLTAAPIAG